MHQYARVPGSTACAQTSCDGLDPALTYLRGSTPPHLVFRSAGARNVSDLPNGEPVLGGHLELRWSPNCQTNRTRFTPGNNDTYEIFVVGSTGVLAGNGVNHVYEFSRANGVAHYGDQVYSPGPAQAYVYDVTTRKSAVYSSRHTEPGISRAGAPRPRESGGL